MANNYAKNKGRKESGQYMSIPYCVLKSENFIKLSGNAIKLLFDIFYQYNGKNNGEFKAAWSFMSEKRGWKSKQTLSFTLKELLHYGFIIQTQAGGKNKYAFYAVTWLQIDKADDASVIKSFVTTKIVPNSYKQLKKDYRRPKKAKVIPFNNSGNRKKEDVQGW